MDKVNFLRESQGNSHKYTPYLLIFTGAKVIFFFEFTKAFGVFVAI